MNPVSSSASHSIVPNTAVEHPAGAAPCPTSEPEEATRPDEAVSLRPAAVFLPQDPADTAPMRAYDAYSAPRAPENLAVPETHENVSESASEPARSPRMPEQAGRKEPSEPEPAERPEKEKEAEKCTINTDRVDQEIESLRRRVAELKQAASAGDDSSDAENELRQAERELMLKDNDQYRRQHASVRNG